MFKCLKSWIAEQASKPASRWLRIAVPVSLRTGDGDSTSAANQVSYTFLTRDRHRCDDSDELLRGIGRENPPGLRRRRSLMFLRGMRCLTGIPGAMSLYMGINRCFATVVLSNLGDISRSFGSPFPCESGKIIAGNLMLESILAVPRFGPIRGPPSWSIEYDGRLRVCVRCDPRVFTANDARRLLSLYVDRLRRTL